MAKRIRSGSKPVCRNHWARFWQNGIGPLPVSCIQCGPDHIVRHRPGSDLVPDGHVRLCPNGSVLEASRCARIIGPGSVKTQPAHFQFPCIRCGSVFPQTAWIILCDLVLDGHVRLWPNGSNTEANRCAKFIGPSSGKTQPACFLFPAFHLVLFFHRWPRSYCAKQAWIQFGSGWPCRVVAKRIWSGSKLVGKNHWAWFWQNAIIFPGSVKHNWPTSSFPASDSVSFFHKRPGSYSAIWVLMAMSGCGQMDPIRKQTGVQNSLGPVLAKRNRPASCFPHSIWFRSSTDGLDHIVRNRPGSDLVLDGHVRLWPNGSGPEASWCARIIGPGSGKTEPALFWQNATGPVLAKRNRPCSGKTEPALFWQNATGPNPI